MKHCIRLLSIAIVLTGLILSACDDNEPHLRELNGNWAWTKSCGGFGGTCSYPDGDNYRSLLITSATFKETINGVVTMDMAYEIKDELVDDENPNTVSYELTLEDETGVWLTLHKDQNTLIKWSPGIFADYYKGNP
jgi:hypothetical protein